MTIPTILIEVTSGIAEINNCTGPADVIILDYDTGSVQHHELRRDFAIVQDLDKVIAAFFNGGDANEEAEYPTLLSPEETEAKEAP